MAKYLYKASYTPESWAGMLQSPQDRVEAIRPAVERLGGTVEAFWMAFGECDVVGVCEMPDAISASAFAMSAIAGGGPKTFRTTPLLSIEEGLEAMRKAGDVGYRPPGK